MFADGRGAGSAAADAAPAAESAEPADPGEAAAGPVPIASWPAGRAGRMTPAAPRPVDTGRTPRTGAVAAASFGGSPSTRAPLALPGTACATATGDARSKITGAAVDVDPEASGAAVGSAPGVTRAALHAASSPSASAPQALRQARAT
jgi:hypothetical protein